MRRSRPFTIVVGTKYAYSPRLSVMRNRSPSRSVPVIVPCDEIPSVRYSTVALTCGDAKTGALNSSAKPPAAANCANPLFVFIRDKPPFLDFNDHLYLSQRGCHL